MMILYNDATSPFGRKVVVAAMERAIPMRETFIDLQSAEALDRHNPLRQIPTLVDKDGRGVYDSDVILQYLDELVPDRPLFPRDRQVEVLTRVALANGLMEATMARLMELRRPEQQRSSALVAKLEARIARAISALEREVGALADRLLNADQISVACALAYVDFRFSAEWRSSAAGLSRWYEEMASRESLERTAPTRSGPVGATVP